MRQFAADLLLPLSRRRRSVSQSLQRSGSAGKCDICGAPKSSQVTTATAIAGCENALQLPFRPPRRRPSPHARAAAAAGRVDKEVIGVCAGLMARDAGGGGVLRFVPACMGSGRVSFCSAGMERNRKCRVIFAHFDVR